MFKSCQRSDTLETGFSANFHNHSFKRKLRFFSYLGNCRKNLSWILINNLKFLQYILPLFLNSFFVNFVIFSSTNSLPSCGNVITFKLCLFLGLCTSIFWPTRGGLCTARGGISCVCVQARGEDQCHLFYHPHTNQLSNYFIPPIS